MRASAFGAACAICLSAGACDEPGADQPAPSSLLVFAVVEPGLEAEPVEPAGILFLSTRGGQAWIAREQDGAVLVDRVRVTGGALVFLRVEPALLEPGTNSLALSVATDSGETLRERITIPVDAECTRVEHCQAGECVRYQCQG